MAKNNPVANSVYQGNSGSVAQQTFDPFNLTGWNSGGGAGYGGVQPNNPAYEMSFDPSTMSFAPEIQSRLGGLSMDMRGMDKFRDDALRSRPSAWAGMMNKLQYANEAGAKDRAVDQSRAGVRTGEADLASKGGLSSGARERLARGGAKDLLAVGQDVSRQGNLNRMQVGIQDEQNRVQELSQLPGMENNLLQTNLQKEGMYDQAKQQDLARAIAENDKRNQYNQNLYNQKMSAWAADRQAYATENSGKK
jgi:hypothetical protein